MQQKFNLADFIVALGLCWLVTILLAGHKVTRRFAKDPVAPVDPAALAVWHAHRRHILALELFASLALALGAVILQKIFDLDVWIAMALSYAAAIGGLPLMGHIILTLLGQRLGVEIKPRADMAAADVAAPDVAEGGE